MPNELIREDANVRIEKQDDGRHLFIPKSGKGRWLLVFLFGIDAAQPNGSYVVRIDESSSADEKSNS